MIDKWHSIMESDCNQSKAIDACLIILNIGSHSKHWFEIEWKLKDSEAKHQQECKAKYWH